MTVVHPPDAKMYLFVRQRHLVLVEEEDYFIREVKLCVFDCRFIISKSVFVGLFFFKSRCIIDKILRFRDYVENVTIDCHFVCEFIISFLCYSKPLSWV